jgi:hypothetical protein
VAEIEVLLLMLAKNARIVSNVNYPDHFYHTTATHLQSYNDVLALADFFWVTVEVAEESRALYLCAKELIRAYFDVVC